jgi:hypothetical protein
MKGKVGLVLGLAAGYVLGSRAGHERYEQIKEQAAKVWNTDPVQKQVEKAKAFGASAAKVVPGALWDGAKRVSTAASGSGSVQEKARRAAAEAKSAAKGVKDAVGDSLDEADDSASSGGGASTGTQSPSTGAQGSTSGAQSPSSSGS